MNASRETPTVGQEKFAAVYEHLSRAIVERELGSDVDWIVHGVLL
jgi:hypothetical protein